MKSYQYIDLAKKQEKLTTYKLAQKTGIADSTFSQYKTGKRIMDDYACFKIAEILCIDPRKIIARANQEREKDEEKREFWSDKIKEYGFTEIKLLLSIIALFLIGVVVYIFNVVIPNRLTDSLTTNDFMNSSYNFIFVKLIHLQDVQQYILC